MTTYRAKVTMPRPAHILCPFDVALYADGKLIESFSASSIGDANTLGRCLVTFEDDTVTAFAAYVNVTMS